MQLLVMMVERVGIIVILGFFLANTKIFRRFLQDPKGIKEKLILIFIFSFFSIISNYTGIEIQGHQILQEAWILQVGPNSSIANTRILGVVIGGLTGGPIVGVGVGLIAGLHRFMLGGVSAGSYAVSSLLAGVISGYIGYYFRISRKIVTPRVAALVGISMEILQMGIILLFAHSFVDAWALVSIIGIPMIIVNGTGSFVFISIFQAILRQEEQTKALQTNQVLRIADQTLPYFRQGLKQESCTQVANIIFKHTGADAVSLTDNEKILAHVGAGSDHHIPSHSLITGLSKAVLKTGKVRKAGTRREIACENKACPLEAAIVLPLTSNGRTIGTLKMYFTNPNNLSRVEEELAEGLANIFSTQLELGEAELQSKLLKDAEIKALQAQVNPHFLFNAINTISALMRRDIEMARKLLLQLSVYFRSNLQGARHLLIPLEQELNHVYAYLSLEQARFPDKYTVVTDIEEGIQDILLPPFILQILVENALRHAFPKSQKNCRVDIQIRSKGEFIHIVVKDNGKGIELERLQLLGKAVVSSKKGTGTALFNINERLKGLFGKETQLFINSHVNAGTEVRFTIPLQQSANHEQEE